VLLLQLLLLPSLQGLGVTYGNYGMKPFSKQLGVIQGGKIRQVGGVHHGMLCSISSQHHAHTVVEVNDAPRSGFHPLATCQAGHYQRLCSLHIECRIHCVLLCVMATFITGDAVTAYYYV
jgi:hypothetical protein